jgi:hypothetical protein
VTRLRGPTPRAGEAGQGSTPTSVAITTSDLRAASLFGGMSTPGPALVEGMDPALLGPVVSLPGGGPPGRMMSASERAALAASRTESPAPVLADDGTLLPGNRVQKKEKKKRVVWPEDDAKLEAVRLFRKVGAVYLYTVLGWYPCGRPVS